MREWLIGVKNSHSLFNNLFVKWSRKEKVPFSGLGDTSVFHLKFPLDTASPASFLKLNKNIN